MSGRTGGWKGVFSVHSWVVVKPENAHVLAALRRGRLGRSGADQRLGAGRPLVRQHAAGGASTCAARRPRRRIPKIEAAVKDYQYANAGDYRIWPGPNSNTFVATVLRAIPEAEAIAAGQRGRPRLPPAGPMSA